LVSLAAFVNCSSGSSCLTNTDNDSAASGFGKDSLGNIYSTGFGIDGIGDSHFITRKSTNSGTTWATVDDFIYTGGNYSKALGFGTDTAGNLYAVGYGTDFLNAAHYLTRQSTDNGATWNTVDDFDYTDGTYSIAYAVGVDTAGNVYTVGVGHDAFSKSHYIVRMSVDQGLTWNTVDDFVFTGGNGSQAYGFGVDASGNVYTVGYGTDSSNASHYIVRKSTNHGTTWATIDDFVFTGGNYSVAMGFGVDSAGNLYSVGVGVDASFIKHYITRQSTNGGTSWATVDDFTYAVGATQATANSIVADSSGHIYTSGFATDTSNISHYITRVSTNAGAAWATVDDFVYTAGSTPNTANALGLDSSGNVYSVGMGTDVNSHSHFVTRMSSTHGAAWATVDDFIYAAPSCL
jgi:hypothetical protein